VVGAYGDGMITWLDFIPGVSLLHLRLILKAFSGLYQFRGNRAEDATLELDWAIMEEE
jgi:hypothetical protein